MNTVEVKVLQPIRKKTSLLSKSFISGSYCPIGTEDPIPCPAGTYGAAVQLTAEGACTACTAGSYCKAAGLLAVSSLDYKYHAFIYIWTCIFFIPNFDYNNLLTRSCYFSVYFMKNLADQ